MTKSKFSRILFLPIILCILFALSACGSIEAPNTGGNPGGNKPGGNKPGSTTSQLASVDKSSIKVTETAHTLVVEWNAVPNATSYRLLVETSTSTSITAVTVEEGTSVDLKALGYFAVPDTGSITIVITAKGSGYTDSEPVTITYELEGILLLSPEIISFNNGVIEWKSIAGASYTVKVNGTANAVTTNTFNIGNLTANAQIDIFATIGGKNSSTTSVMYNASTKKLSVMPVTEYTLEGDILKWGEVGGAVGYKVVDLDFNAYVVKIPHYIMDIRNIVYGVYPVMASDSVVGSAEVSPVDIKYLQGTGTAADPYLIKTPFDLRTIDYYELKFSESSGKAKNNYKIVGDINYNTVSVVEGESNVFTLRKPFFGVLDGDNKTLSNMYVNYNYGFWSLFEFIATGAIVKNIKFEGAELHNAVQDTEHPVNPATAMLAYRNYGTVTNVALSNSKMIVTAGDAAGLVIHNYGTVSACTVTGCELKEAATSAMGAAAYEMAGVVLHNYGMVGGNNVINLTISGSGTNIGSAAGVVSINRSGGNVIDNSFGTVTVNNLKAGKEAGGVVAYCAKGGTVTKGSGTLGTLKVGTQNSFPETGTSASPRGTLCGKKD